jgi:hypothetical protein
MASLAKPNFTCCVEQSIGQRICSLGRGKDRNIINTILIELWCSYQIVFKPGTWVDRMRLSRVTNGTAAPRALAAMMRSGMSGT